MARAFIAVAVSYFRKEGNRLVTLPSDCLTSGISQLERVYRVWRQEQVGGVSFVQGMFGEGRPTEGIRAGIPLPISARVAAPTNVIPAKAGI